jgi:hypothetical protein
VGLQDTERKNIVTQTVSGTGENWQKRREVDPPGDCQRQEFSALFDRA